MRGFLSWLGLTLLAASPPPVAAQADTIPEESTWGLRFALPEAGGGSLGAEWFPTESVGITGSTGVHATYGTTQNERLEPPGRTESYEWRLGAFRSDLFLSLYF